jgi:peroxiredoxin
LQSLIPANRRNQNLIVGVSPDPLDKFKDVIPLVTARTSGSFLITLLSDAQHTVTDRYGLRNQESAERGKFLPYPTTYVIDGKGTVRWKFTEKNQAVRPPNETILAEIKKLW